MKNHDVDVEGYRGRRGPLWRMPDGVIRWVLYPLLFALAVIIVQHPWRKQPAGEAWRPRIVILMAIDTCRADHLRCYGYDRDTSPNIDRMAARGVLFERAFSQANESLFSYASLLTGVFPERIARMSYDDFRLDGTRPTVPTALRAGGVRTAAFVAGGHLNHAFGFDRGFEIYEDAADFGSLHQTFPPAMQWLAQLPRNARGFLMLQGYDAHAPYSNALWGERFDPGYANGLADQIVEVPDASDNIFRGAYFTDLPTQRWFQRNPLGQRVLNPRSFDHLRARAQRPGRSVKLTEADVHHLVAHYDACVAYADVYVGLLMSRLQELGIENETMVVLIGDHGEDLMEHDFFNHRDAVNDSCTHVPLVVWGPGGIAGGRRVADVVQLVDVGPTLVDAFGAELGKRLDGRSLRGLVNGATDARGDGTAFSEGILPMITARERDARLVFDGSSREPLPPLDERRFRFYEIGADGREHAAPPRGAPAERLHRALGRWRDSL